MKEMHTAQKGDHLTKNQHHTSTQKKQQTAAAQSPKYHAHRKRMRKARSYGYGFAAFVLLAIAFMVIASWDPRVSITHIAVTGDSTIEKHTIENEVRETLLEHGNDVISPTTIATADPKLITTTLLYTFPQLKSVTVSRYFFNTLTVNVHDRTEQFVWCTDAYGLCYSVDDTGYVYARRPSSQDFYVSGGLRGDPLRQSLAPQIFKTVLSAKRDLADQSVHPNHVEINDDRTEALVYLLEGPYVMIPISEHPEELTRVFESVFTTERVRQNLASYAYIDMRFGNRVFLKPLDETKMDEETTDESPTPTE